MKNNIPATVNVSTILGILFALIICSSAIVNRLELEDLLCTTALFLIPVLIRMGVNWGRIVFIVFYTSVSFFLIAGTINGIVRGSTQLSIIKLFESVFMSVMIITSIVLLVFPSSNRWFKEIKRQKKEEKEKERAEKVKQHETHINDN